MVFLLPLSVGLLSGMQGIKRITNTSFQKAHGSFLPVRTQPGLEAPGLKASRYQENTCREIGSIRETNAMLKVSGF